ncbi:hypothetical protein KIPB_005777 [Kipferlia bialata]|uniref:Geranylgeranyl transferase type II subunit alpha n=1 Tax=Kipferlia bialata TaxID=797122 RepID=A0A9K3GJB3_9EUKA|nr:hypothetical protein KIPB_005710 [Kipferlia bialata]GIQ84311.1 hypothetical protein KIPB_005777 [Kipferlia bialata]|eukprot:g5710.t1
MHGVKKSAIPPTAQELEQKKKQVDSFRSLINGLLAKREQGNMNPKILPHIGIALKYNPEHYTLWNYRRDILTDSMSQPVTEGVEAEAEGVDGEGEGGGVEDANVSAVATLTEELGVIEAALAKNPKVYSAWHHRRWVMDHILARSGAEDRLAIVHKELDLCKKLLTKGDSRNFHCWNHRRHVLTLLTRETQGGRERERETAAKTTTIPSIDMPLTLALIESDFTNHSAWHQRRLAIQQILTERESETSGERETVDMEFELDNLMSGVSMEPDSEGLFHIWYWLVSTGLSLSGCVGAEAEGVLETQLETYMPLYEDEPEHRYPLLMAKTCLFLLGRQAEADALGADQAMNTHWRLLRKDLSSRQ